MMHRVEDGARGPLLLGTDVSRGFVVRTGKQGARRGGMGAVRVRETYLRGDRLLVSMKDTLLGGSGGGGEGGHGSPPSEGLSDSKESTNYRGGGCYVCPTADFLHCYLELFGRPSFAACFIRGGNSSSSSDGFVSTLTVDPAAAQTTLGGASGGDSGGAGGGGCNLLLLHSELSKLTGATGALSIKQERHLAQLARSLPGTVVFFDTFCPDLHGATAAALGASGKRPPAGTGSACPLPPPPPSSLSSSTPPPSRPLDPSPPMVAACRWCIKELGNTPVVMLSDDAAATPATPATASMQESPRRQVVAGLGEEAAQGEGEAARVGEQGLLKILGLRDFLRNFVGGEAGEELTKRGELLRSVYLANKAASQASSLSAVAASKGGDAGVASPLAVPHPSKTQLEALVAAGEALKGKLDVFEHNPREGVVVVGAGGARVGAEGALEGWTDVSGRTKVLVVGREGMNRSIHGDTVAITLLPKRRWRAPTDVKRLTHAAEEEDILSPLDEEEDLNTGDRGGEGQAPPGAMPTGLVVGVVEEGRRPYVVTIPPEDATGQAGGSSSAVAAVPMDPRVPKIRIKTRQLAQISGQRLVVMVDGWEPGHMFPFGHYVTSLGPVGEVSSEAAALLVECEASFQSFSFNALASLPLVPNPPKEWQKPRDALTPTATLAELERPESGFGQAPRWQDSGWRVGESDVAGRRDLRGERAMSVDPPGCQDIDDAMHVKRRPDGKLEIGVHIADVTRFVEADGPLDREARARGTTIYLVHRRIDMLPALLSSDLCSLHAGTDRLSVSVMWEAEEDGEDIRICKRADGSPVRWFGRTVIRSKASMTYDQAQQLVEDGKIAKARGHEEPPPGQAGRDVADALQPGLAHDLRLLTRFARTARAARVKNGAIDLSQAGAELKFKIDPSTGIPLAVAGKEDSEIHHTIAELMILANSAVAEKTQGTFPSSALVRVHARPDPSRLTAFEGVAAKAGVKCGGGGNGRSASAAEGLTASLATVEGGALQDQGEGGRSKAGLLKSLAVRAMSEAEYVSTGTLSDHQASGTGREAGDGDNNRFGHFGLGLSHYTHFTSPIRRYADIVVHRLLLASLGVASSASAVCGQVSKPPYGQRTRPRLLISGYEDGAAEDGSALPPSSVPSVMEMEEAAVGKAAMDAEERRSRRAGAGDASYVTNPDGTRTYSKVTVSAPMAATTTACRAPPPPGMEAFPDLEARASRGDGDDLLDALLALDVSASTPVPLQRLPPATTTLRLATTTTGGSRRNFEAGGDRNKLFSEVAAAPPPAADAAAAGSAGDNHGDSLLDELLGLVVETTPGMAGGGGVGGGGGGGATFSYDGATFGAVGVSSNGNGSNDAGPVKPEVEMRKGDAAGTEDRVAVGMAGGGVAVCPPPFGGAELGQLCTHLNDRNRRAKQLAQRCQDMFLRLFFKDHSQVVQGLVLSLRSNGFIAYVPAFDAKGPVYISDRDGQVQVDPALLGLPANAGGPPSKGFAMLPACRALPGASVSLVVSSPPANVAARRGEFRDDVFKKDEQDEAEEVLEIRPNPGSGGKALRLGVLDGVSLRLSCEVLPTQARLPRVRFLLAGVGNLPVSRARDPQKPSADATSRPRSTKSSRPVDGGGARARCGINPSGERVGEDSEHPGRVGGVAGAAGASGDAQGLYWLLQGARDNAVCASEPTAFDLGGPGGSPSLPPAAESAAVEESRVATVIAERRKEKKSKNSNKGQTRSTAAERLELGAGRALFGGFVPCRQAPAASLYDFGSSTAGDKSVSEYGGGGGAAGGLSGVSALPSIYSYGASPRGAGSSGGSGGTLTTLDDAKVRQYTQEATARAQRLGAEKRSSRISKSKRQG